MNVVQVLRESLVSLLDKWQGVEGERMSMNLCCKEVSLHQTPTHITYLCYYADYAAQVPSDWKTIRDKYILWCQSITNHTQNWEEHHKHVADLMRRKKLTFSIE